jgi:hypothetical protein
MSRQFTLLLALATLSATAITASAQSQDPAGPNTNSDATIQSPPPPAPPAPIERGSTGPYGYNLHATTLTTGQVLSTTHHTATAQPALGIFLRVGRDSSVRAIAVGAENTELKVERGLINISVHHPASGAQILVDLPGGQTALLQVSLLKDGLYTVNAATNTVRVLKGEAIAYPSNQKRIKIKEEHAVVLNGPNVHSFEFDPPQARADLIPYAPAASGEGAYGPGAGYGPRYPGYGFYGDGYPYDAYGYPYGYPYGYGYGYPFGFGLGFGYFGGGFYGGGFHGHR